jgi:hypothetical protein
MILLNGPPLPLGVNDWQKYCTSIFRECLGSSTGFSDWAEARPQLIRFARKLIADRRHQRIIIADIDLTAVDLQKFDLSYCFLTRVHLENANLSGGSFLYAIVRNSSLLRCTANGTDFGYADIEDTNLLEVRYNQKTNWNLTKRPQTAITAELIQRIERDRRIASIHSLPFAKRIVAIATGYGVGAGRLLLLFIGSNFIFAIVYDYIDRCEWSIGAGSLKSQSLSFWNFLFLSFERSLNASPWIYGTSILTHFLTTLQTVIGIGVLALLVSIFIYQVLRR